MYRASVVEIYKCSGCNTIIRFPRYNHARILLETRRGRCGEWAQCFTLCCRAVGLQARIVVDFTDHVWTEVWSRRDQRFIHADSCEKICDEPLLYEKGWGKKLNYCIAVGWAGYADVSFNYTLDVEAMKSRRKLVTEQQLTQLIEEQNQQVVNSIID